MSSWGFDTQAVHTTQSMPASGRPTAQPLYDSAAFAYETAEELEQVFAGRRPGHVYSRISNPTVAAFEARIAALEEGRGAVALASGMAAVTAAVTALARSGDSVVFSRSLFGGTLLLARKVLPRYGVDSRFVDLENEEVLSASIDGTTRALFVESIGNPKLDVPRLDAVCSVASERGIPVIVDNTLATPVLLKPRAHGAALVVHSTTKYINGNGTSVGGAVVDTGVFDWSRHPDGDLVATTERAGGFGFLVHLRRRIVQNIGSFMAPIVAWTQLQGVPTLGLRVRRQCENALALARFLDRHRAVEAVHYPGLPSSRWYEAAAALLDGGFGGLLTLRLGSRDRAYTCLNALTLVSQLANLGDAKTLAIHPASTIYRDCSEEERRDAGVHDDLIRVSVGIETIEDIIQDFAQALGGLT